MLASFCLVACGGGAGGESTARIAVEPPPPTVGTGSVRLTESNAGRAIGIVLSGVGDAARASFYVANSLEVLSNLIAAHELFDRVGGCSGSLDVSVGYGWIDTDASATLTAGDTISSEVVDCLGVTTKARLSISEIDVSAEGLSSLSGSLTFEVDLEGSDTSGTASVRLTGQLSGMRWDVDNIEVTTESDGSTYTTSSALFESEVDRSGSYSALFEGTADIESDDLNGRLTFRTEQVFEGDDDRYPTAGMLVLVGDDSEVQVTPSADQELVADHADYRVDTDGTGQYGERSSVLWRQWFDGSLFGHPNTRPTIESLHIEPAHAVTTDVLKRVYAVNDLDGDRVHSSFRWFRDGTPIVDGIDLSPDWTRKGDRIEVKMTATDGRGPSTETAHVTIQNTEPAIVDLSVLPPSPTTADDLVPSVQIDDPDEEDFEFVYEWRINGVVSDHTGPVLPAGEHRRGDSVELALTASDGEASDSSRATIEILDASPRVAVDIPPQSAMYSDLVSFEASAWDPDGDPVGDVRFQVDYGPPGMEIDPQTGTVTWDAAVPMFGRPMEFAWSLSLEETEDLSLSDVIVLESPPDTEPILRTGIGFLPQGKLRIADFNGDGKEQVMVSDYSLYELAWTGTDFVQTWTYPFALGDGEGAVFAGFATRDMDGDDRHEIFVSASGSIVRLDGEKRTESAATELAYDSLCARLEIEDLDGDGDYELICLIERSSGVVVTVLSAESLDVLWQSSILYGFSSDLAIGNVDDDVALEIVHSRGYVFDGATYADQWSRGEPFGWNVLIHDVDGDGVNEIVATDDEGLIAFDAREKTVRWELQESFQVRSMILLETDDSSTAILVAEQFGRVILFDTDQNGFSKRYEKTLIEMSGIGAIAVGDIDHDGGQEILLNAGHRWSGRWMLVSAGAGPDHPIEWTNLGFPQLDGPFFAGGSARTPGEPGAVMFLSGETDNGYAPWRLVSMSGDGSNLSVNPVEDRFTIQDRGRAIRVADFDNDGTDEVFVAGDALIDGFPLAYDFFNQQVEWTYPGHYPTAAIDASDMNDDGHEDLVALSYRDELFLEAFDAFNRSSIWEREVESAGAHSSPGQAWNIAAVEASGAGAPDIVVVTERQVSIFGAVEGEQEHSELRSWVFEPTSEGERIIDGAAADMNGDGRYSVFVLAGKSRHPSLVYRFDEELNLLNKFELDLPATAVFIENSEVARKNILVATALSDYARSFISAHDPATGIRIWRSPPLLGAIQRSGVQPLKIQGENRLSIGTRVGMYLTR